MLANRPDMVMKLCQLFLTLLICHLERISLPEDFKEARVVLLY